MDSLYLIEGGNGIVFTYSRQDDRTWRFSRLCDSQREKNAFVMSYRLSPPTGCKVFGGPESAEAPAYPGWVLQDLSASAKDEVIGYPRADPSGHLAAQQEHRPPLGAWTVWGCSYALVDQVPELK